MLSRRHRWTIHLSLFGLVAMLPFASMAVDLHEDERSKLSLDIDVGYGQFHSERAYAQTTVSSGHRNWTEGYADFALTGSLAAWKDSHWYGSVGSLSTATWGDGDAAGFTTGDSW